MLSKLFAFTASDAVQFSDNTLISENCTTALKSKSPSRTCLFVTFLTIPKYQYIFFRQTKDMNCCGQTQTHTQATASAPDTTRNPSAPIVYLQSIDIRLADWSGPCLTNHLTGKIMRKRAQCIRPGAKTLRSRGTVVEEVYTFRV